MQVSKWQIIRRNQRIKLNHITPHRGIGLARVLHPKLQQPQADHERVLHLADMGVHLTDLDPDLLLPGWNLPNRTLSQSARLNLTCHLVQDMQEGARIQVTIQDKGHLIIHVHQENGHVNIHPLCLHPITRVHQEHGYMNSHLQHLQCMH